MKLMEKAGTFYLGKEIDPKTGKTNQDLLFDSKDLTTHAVCVGMTGSGKTGLGISVLEEAALNKIPAIVIDPKGDIGNLLLTFPDLTPQEFLPWIDPAEAARKGISPEAYSKEIAETWANGLKKWDEDSARIKKLKSSADFAIYTPTSNAGIPISILNSFAAPSKEELADPTFLREKVLSVCSSLLGLLGIKADPIKSREHILISNIMMNAWENGKDLDISSLIQQIQKPPFNKIGALEIDTFYPPKERMALSISLNNLLASPGFQAWMEGEPLDIKSFLYTPAGKPKISIISIAHLSDSERMFFVTLLLNEVVSWMRRQEGSSSLRTILYMDEIFGFFPPSAAPPSKLPMLTLLKQARAFGLGIFLVTQNPVDLDYKGLSNCGTWFIGKLQTERDKSRVIEGLQVASNGEIDSKTLDKMIAATGNRIFIMRSIHQKDPILFQTRWTLSYLRGPLTLSQIETLTSNSSKPIKQQKSASLPTPSSSKPIVPSEIEEFFYNGQSSSSNRYEPRILAIGKLHFVDSKNKIDSWEDICFALPTENDGKNIDWTEGKNLNDLKKDLQKKPNPESSFEELPSGLMQEKTYKTFEKSFTDSLYQNQTLTLFQAPAINMISKSGENKEEFQKRISEALKERQEDSVKKLQSKYADKISTLKSKIQKAENKAENISSKAWTQRIQAFISFITTLLTAFFGRRRITKGTITQSSTTLRRVGRIGQDNRQMNAAEDELETYRQQLEDVETQMNSEIAAVSNVNNVVIDDLTIRPRKSDISVEKIALVWWRN